MLVLLSPGQGLRRKQQTRMGQRFQTKDLNRIDAVGKSWGSRER